jgi:hypothetical protein
MDIETAKAIARKLSTALSDAFGSDKRIVYAPDCPPIDQFGRQVPRHAVEISFFSDPGRTDCIISARDFRSGQVVFTRRMGLHRIATREVALETLAAETRDALWLSGIADLPEFVEDLVLVFGCDANARIADGDRHKRAGTAMGDAGDVTAFGERHGVGDQIDDHLHQSVSVPADRWQIAGHVDMKGKFIRCVEAVRCCRQLTDDRSDIERFDIPDHLARLDLFKVKNVVDHLD